MTTETFSLCDHFAPVSPQQWRKVVEADLKGAAFEKRLISHTYEGIDIQPVYTREDWPGDDDPSGFPGLAPFTRGGAPLGGTLGGWDICQEHAHPDPAQANAAILTDLQRGATGILLRLDMAARSGMDPAKGAAAEWVGRDGVAIHHRRDLELALAGVHLDMAGVALEAGAAFMPAAAALIALWQDRGIDPARARGAFNADPLAVLARDGRLPCPLERAMALMADLACYSSENLPMVTAVRVGTGPYHHAGATAAQDLAFSMATAVAYLRAMTDRGMSVEAAARQLLFSYSVGCNFFLAIAKLRAARKLWAAVLRACGVSPDVGEGQVWAPEAMKMHVRTSKRVITARDPWVNLLRNTVCCFAGAVAGAQSITSEPFDKALGLPDELSRRIARNTQVILMEEAHLGFVNDPAGGCWMLERLTDQLAETAWPIFQQIERQGGMGAALRSGWVGEQIDSAFRPRLKNLATRRDAITGVSEFPNLSEKPLPRPQPDGGAIREAVIARLSQLGNTPEAEAAARRLGQAAAGSEPGTLVRLAAEAAAVDLPLWRIQAALVESSPGSGEPLTIAPLTPHPYAEPFEQLRDASDAHLARTGARPKVFLANLGPIAQHTARAGYARNFFEAGGFEVVSNDGFDDAQAAAKALAASGARIAVICSSDALYEKHIEQVAPRLKAAGARTLILAGFPGQNEGRWREAGVDRFIYIKCDVLGTLRELLRQEGVLQ